jgi:hypothetical protein
LINKKGLKKRKMLENSPKKRSLSFCLSVLP